DPAGQRAGDGGLDDRVALELPCDIAGRVGGDLRAGPVLFPPDGATLLGHRVKPIITVDNLGKAYYLGRRLDKHQTFRDAVVDFARGAATRVKQRFADPATRDDAFWAV